MDQQAVSGEKAARLVARVRWQKVTAELLITSHRMLRMSMREWRQPRQFIRNLR